MFRIVFLLSWGVILPILVIGIGVDNGFSPWQIVVVAILAGCIGPFLLWLSDDANMNWIRDENNASEVFS